MEVETNENSFNRGQVVGPTFGEALGCLVAPVLYVVLSPYFMVTHFIRRAFLKKFTRQLLMLLELEVPLYHALRWLEAYYSGTKALAVIRSLMDGLETGESLSARMREYPRTFPRRYRATIENGESSGDPADFLLALRLLSGDLDFRKTSSARTAESENVDTFARRLRG